MTALDDTKTAVGIVNLRAELLKPIDEVKRMALDPYATFRSLYRQHREAAIQEVRDDHRATVPDWFPANRDRRRPLRLSTTDLKTEDTETNMPTRRKAYDLSRRCPAARRLRRPRFRRLGG